jgi:putative ABC transport system ATP-binding protein
MPNDTAPAPILVNRVTLRYRRGDVGSVALDDLTLAIRPAELLCITGPSGSGKSSLLNVLAGLQRPTEGSVLYNGTAISDMPEDLLLRWRRDHVGFVFQFHNLFPALTAEDNVAVPLVLFPLDQASARGRGDRARRHVDASPKAPARALRRPAAADRHRASPRHQCPLAPCR